MTDIKPSDVRRAAMDFLARREHSRYEILCKLTRRLGDNPDLFEQEVGKLTNEGLQSDRRLAEAFIRARTNRGQGPVKIKMELRNKQVSDDIITTAFEECGVDFLALAQSVAVRKFRDALHKVVESEVQDPELPELPELPEDPELPEALNIKALDVKTQARISRFMQQRGFSYEHISSLY
jgi:regulatory protein|tara:strand:+ start:4644 stop:5183 length:540 start_codon:yes stop_codon:yes gene_type:complete